MAPSLLNAEDRQAGAPGYPQEEMREKARSKVTVSIQVTVTFFLLQVQCLRSLAIIKHAL
jgi:hypothetical protein